jgi:hypothetical protein
MKRCCGGGTGKPSNRRWNRQIFVPKVKKLHKDHLLFEKTHNQGARDYKVFGAQEHPEKGAHVREDSVQILQYRKMTTEARIKILNYSLSS